MCPLEASDLLLTDGPAGVNARLEARTDGVVLLFRGVHLALLGRGFGRRSRGKLLVCRGHGEGEGRKVSCERDDDPDQVVPDGLPPAPEPRNGGAGLGAGVWSMIRNGC